MNGIKVFEFISLLSCVKINLFPAVHSFSSVPFSIGMHVLIFTTYVYGCACDGSGKIPFYTLPPTWNEGEHLESTIMSV